MWTGVGDAATPDQYKKKNLTSSRCSEEFDSAKPQNRHKSVGHGINIS